MFTENSHTENSHTENSHTETWGSMVRWHQHLEKSRSLSGMVSAGEWVWEGWLWEDDCGKVIVRGWLWEGDCGRVIVGR